MNTQKIVLIGGPGTGKTSVIRALESRGFKCFHEISREVTAEAQKKGIEQLFLTEPLLFSDMLLNGRIQQFVEAEDVNESHVFFDRGIPDVTAYMDYLNTPYPKRFSVKNENFKYDAVFFFPIWKDIYQQDNERYESYEEALTINKYLKETYEGLGYTLIEVPKTSIDERINFIESHI